MNLQDISECALLFDSPSMEVRYEISKPTKAELVLVPKDGAAERNSWSLDFGDVLAPPCDYVKSFLHGVLSYPKGHTFSFEDVECIPHYENFFLFYPFNLDYVFNLVFGLAQLGLFKLNKETALFSMEEAFHDAMSSVGSLVQ